MTSSADGLRRSSKALSKAELAPKKGHGFWWSASSLSHYSFWNPRETIISEKDAQQIDEMYQTAMPAASTGQQKGPNSPQQRLTV